MLSKAADCTRKKKGGGEAYRLALQSHRVDEHACGDFGAVPLLVHPLQGHKARLERTLDHLSRLTSEGWA